MLRHESLKSDKAQSNPSKLLFSARLAQSAVVEVNNGCDATRKPIPMTLHFFTQTIPLLSYAERSVFISISIHSWASEPSKDIKFSLSSLIIDFSFAGESLGMR